MTPTNTPSGAAEALRAALEQCRRAYRSAEMSAEIMRDGRRTGGWEGSERTARAFDRIAADARKAHELIAALERGEGEERQSRDEIYLDGYMERLLKPFPSDEEPNGELAGEITFRQAALVRRLIRDAGRLRRDLAWTTKASKVFAPCDPITPPPASGGAPLGKGEADPVKRARNAVIEQACEAIACSASPHDGLLKAVINYYRACGDDELADGLIAQFGAEA